MKYRLMGNSGLRVSELALGAMTFSAKDWGVDKDESRRVYEGFREAGGNFIDTANIYSEGRSESFLGEFMAEDRERIVLATKYTGATRGRDVNAAGNNRKNMMDSLHASLRRLRTDYVDLYWVHARDFTTPIEEVMREMGVDLPLMISVAITDASGRTLSGQTIEAFWTSVRHARPFSVGLNCSLGAEHLRPYVM